MFDVVNWLDIHSRVKKMIRTVFEAAAEVHPEMHSPTSRAMYGVDVMLDSYFQPKLLEVRIGSKHTFFSDSWILVSKCTKVFEI